MNRAERRAQRAQQSRVPRLPAEAIKGPLCKLLSDAIRDLGGALVQQLALIVTAFGVEHVEVLGEMLGGVILVEGGERYVVPLDAPKLGAMVAELHPGLVGPVAELRASGGAVVVVCVEDVVAAIPYDPASRTFDATRAVFDHGEVVDAREGCDDPAQFDADLAAIGSYLRAFPNGAEVGKVVRHPTHGAYTVIKPFGFAIAARRAAGPELLRGWAHVSVRRLSTGERVRRPVDNEAVDFAVRVAEYRVANDGRDPELSPADELIYQTAFGKGGGDA